MPVDQCHSAWRFQSAYRRWRQIARRDRGTRLQCLSHNTPLERLRVAPPFPFSSVCQNRCPRKISGHDRPQSRQDSHAHHKPIKVGKTGRLRRKSCATGSSSAMLTASCRAPDLRLQCPLMAVCHEYRRSKRRCATVREMKEGPSGSAIRS